jgi:hypothetical protein
MPIRPHTPKDLLLAPVAAEVDHNLAHLRGKTPSEIDFDLALSFNIDTTGADATQRRGWILAEAVRDVDMHDWQAEITADATSVHLSGGSVTLDVGLSATIIDYIAHGSSA